MKFKPSTKYVILHKRSRYKLISQQDNVSYYNISFRFVELPINIGTIKRPYRLNELKYSKFKLK